MITIMLGLVDALNTLPRQPVSLKAGEALFHRDDPVRFLYVVRCGCIHLTRFDEQGGVAVMQRALAGMVLAESSIFSEIYHCDATAIEDTDLLRIARRDFQKAMRAEPQLAETVARHLAREVQRMRVRVEVLSKKTVRERLDAWMAFGDGAWPARGGMVAIARDIGVSPEAFYREMRRRRVKGGG